MLSILVKESHGLTVRAGTGSTPRGTAAGRSKDYKRFFANALRSSILSGSCIAFLGVGCGPVGEGKSAGVCGFEVISGSGDSRSCRILLPNSGGTPVDFAPHNASCWSYFKVGL